MKFEVARFLFGVCMLFGGINLWFEARAAERIGTVVSSARYATWMSPTQAYLAAAALLAIGIGAIVTCCFSFRRRQIRQKGPEKNNEIAGRASGGEGARQDMPEENVKSKRNPLWWGVFVAIGMLIPTYHLRSFIDLLPPVSALVFLTFYFFRSRLAWHILAVAALVINPLYVFLSPSWRVQTALDPRISWFPIAWLIILATLVFRSRKRYFHYVEQRGANRISDLDAGNES